MKLNNKNFEDEELSHELFLTKRQTTKMRNTFASNMSKSIKLSKTQIFKIIQSGGSFRSGLSNLGKKALANIASQKQLAWIVCNLTSKAVNKFERKISGKGTFRVGKGFATFISNEDMNDFIKIIKLLEDLRVLIDGVNKTVKR